MPDPSSGASHCTFRGKRSHGFLFPVPVGCQDRHRNPESGTQIDGGIVWGLMCGRGPEVEGVAGASAFEAVEGILVEMSREAAAGAGGRAVQGTGSAFLGAPAVERAAEELQDGGDGDGGLDGGEVDGGPRRCRGWRIRDSRLTLAFVLGLAESGAAIAGLGEFAVAVLEDLSILAVEFVFGGNVVDGAVQPRGVVVVGVIGHDLAGVVEGQRHLDADAIAFEGLVPAFDLAVRLGIVRRGFDVGHAGGADELFEVLGDELWSIVGDDAWSFVGVGFAGALEDGADVGFLHFFADFVVDDEATVAVEDGAEEVEGAGDVEVADVDVPVTVWCQWLDKSGAFFGGHG
jgi:hypothetical protein